MHLFNLVTATIITLTTMGNNLKVPEGILHKNVENYTGTNYVIAEDKTVELSNAKNRLIVGPHSVCLVMEESQNLTVYVFNGYASNYRLGHELEIFSEGEVYSNGHLEKFDVRAVLDRLIELCLNEVKEGRK